MKYNNKWNALVAAMLSGIVIFKWQWILSAIGIHVDVYRTGSLLSMEYLISLSAAALLGVFFPTHPVIVSVWLMLGHTLITLFIRVVDEGMPVLLPVELMFLTIMTLPYVLLACGAAYVSRRLMTSGR